MSGFTEGLLAKLRAPFPQAAVSWRVGAMTKDKSRGMALAYIDARDVQDRLDQVCGVFWQVKHHVAGGDKLACEIGIKIGDEWLWRGDGAGATDVEAEKGAFSDSFKRAAVRWGIGRYLYDVASPWVELEAKGNTHVIPDRELRRLHSALYDKEQANVEAPQKPAEGRSTGDVPWRIGQPPGNPAGQNAGEPTATSADQSRSATRSEHPKRQQALDAFWRLETALINAPQPKLVDEIVSINSQDLLLIKQVHPPSYEQLMILANGRKAELYAATP
jgi:hypothetical protein